MSDALPAEIAVKLALATRLTDAYVTLTAAELSTWQAWTAAHNPTIAPSLPAGATPTLETHPDSPETSESRTVPLPLPDVPRCDGCRWWEAHAFDRSALPGLVEAAEQLRAERDDARAVARRLADALAAMSCQNCDDRRARPRGQAGRAPGLS